MDHKAFVEKLYKFRAEPDKLNAIIMRERATLPPEPRTCETCAEYGRDDADCNGDRTGMECIDRSNWKSKAFHSPQTADVETVRNKIELAIKFGIPIDARMALKEAISALDRIAGVLH